MKAGGDVQEGRGRPKTFRVEVESRSLRGRRVLVACVDTQDFGLFAWVPREQYWDRIGSKSFLDGKGERPFSCDII